MVKSPTILVTEDDPSWRMIYQEILEEQGYKVEVAADHDEAVCKLEQKMFDVALVDLRLVDWDPKNQEGMRVVERLKALDAPTQVIVKSGYLTPDVQRRLHELGVFGVLDKEGPVQQLTGLVAKALASGEAHIDG